MNADRLDQLLARVRTGDDAAYGQFLAKAADRLRADLRRQVAGEDMLEDLVRQCLIAAHRKRHTLDADQSASPWLHAIGHYVMANHRRHHQQLPARQLDAPAKMANGMVRLVNHDTRPDQDSGTRRAAILADMILRVRRAVQRRPQLVPRSNA